MPYNTPDASAYTSMRKVLVTHQTTNSIDPVKFRVPSSYSFYKPYYEENLLGNGVVSNKFIVPQQTVVPPPIDQENLILYYDASKPTSYPGTGTIVNDLSTLGFTGTLINGVGYSTTNGGTFTFDGVNDYILADAIGPSSASFTLNCWFKTSNVNDYRMMISKQPFDASIHNYRLWLNLGDGHLIGDIQPQGEVLTFIDHPVNLANGQWHMATFSRDAATHTMKLYVDGNLVQTKLENISNVILTSQPVWIGYSERNGGLYPFSGNIASVFIYGVAQTDQKVNYNYNATKSRFLN